MNTSQAIAQAIHHHRAGHFDTAKTIYRQVLSVEPGNPTALHLSGLIAQHEGELEQAETLIRAAIRHDPHYAEAHNNLGNLLRDKGQMEEALAWHISALGIHPDDCEICFSLGLTSQTCGRLAEAREAYLRALTLNPTYVPAWMNLGNVLINMGKSEEALESLRRAVELQPESAEAHYNLARLLHREGNSAEAATHYGMALNADPRLAEAWYNLGILEQGRARIDEAVESFLHALEIAPAYVDALNNLAGALKARGDIPGAIDCYRQALELRPDDAEIFSNLLFALDHSPAIDTDIVLSLHRDFARQFETPLTSGWPKHANPPDPVRKLRIAYLSPDFRNHPVANFIEPVLRCHNRDSFQIWCLYNQAIADDQTAHLMSQADHWRDIAGLSDEVLAARIQSESIDILVDLAGHTAGNRLTLFARKPAPVQVTWLGYLNTTGLTAMDWRITDAQADPHDADAALYSERLMRLPYSQWCYHPFDSMPSPGPLPALKNAFVTFGSFNNVAKITDETLALWSKVLERQENSRLMLVGVPEGWARRRITSVLRARGVEAKRLAFRGKLPLRGYWEAFSQVDIALDAFPYNGATTTCDALWLGLPVVTLSGESAVSRSARSLLTALGRQAWSASTPDEFAGIACGLAKDIPALTQIRAGLRQEMRISPLMNEKEFTLALERAYRQMWQAWCQSETSA